IGGEALPSSLSVPRTLRSVLTGSLEPLGRITLMVCYMYYTDVFVGPVNIDKLNNALIAELNGSGLTVDLNAELEALASGLEKFIGYDKGVLKGDGIGNNGTGGSQNYASSYNGATWENLCKNCQCNSVPNSSCSSCSCGSSGSSVCDPLKCCENCDVKKAARVFLCFLPCMWYALDYLYKQCKKDESEGGWSDLNISSDNSLTSLGSFFAGMGYDLGKLDENKKGGEISSSLSSLFTSPNGPLKKLYEKSKKYFTSSSSPSLVPSPSSDSPSQPTTVRDILLWLSGLPVTSGFKALLDHCKGLCESIKDSKNSVNFNDFESSLYASCLRSPFVLAAIEDHKEAFKKFPPYESEWKVFSYPEDPSDLLEKLCEYLRKIFPPLKFLCIQCKNDKDSAGWKDCAYGQGCAEALKSSLTSSTSNSTPTSPCCSASAPKGYLCTKTYASNVHEHCTKQGNKCIGPTGKCSDASATKKNPDTDAHSSGQCEKPCPHPLLAFLCDSDSTMFKSLFKLPSGSSVPKMGFSPDNLPSPGRWGRDLSPVLEAFCGSSSLTRLLQFSLCIFRNPPETLGELFGFFRRFRFSDVFTSKFADYASKEPGSYPGGDLKTALKDALETLKGSSTSHSGDHPYDLQSLIDCHVPQGAGATCGPYLNPLAEDVYDIFIEDSPGLYLSWICYLPKDFKTLLEKFKKIFSSCCSSGSSCKSIVKCPCALPLIYSRGFQFMSPSGLGCVDSWGQEHGQQGRTQKHDNENSPHCTRRTCKNFLDQLGKVLQVDAPLHLLINAIDAFLWSIRKPFFLFVLSFWILVFAYFIYVHLYHLDILELNSHDHPAWSFKIPPSILFSDSSSKLKDLSYFTL
ncbi:variant erythrocyte surface antigen-1 family protein, partial [Babesia divergens]